MALDMLPKVIAALARAEDGALTDAERLEACRTLDATMRQLALSADLSADEFEFAQYWQAEVRERLRSALPELLRGLAALSREAEDAASCREASELLDSVAQQMRVLGRIISDRWPPEVDDAPPPSPNRLG